MWIRRLEVTNCAGIAAAGIDFKPGLNVLHGPNELGKSSLVAAIRAALLLQPSASAANGLRDWNSVEPPQVSLTFEQEEQRVWRVRKSFGTSGHAYLDFSKDGVDFAAESKGREVEGTLQNMLRWGIDAPGGRGGRRGMPSSLVSTALLGEQSEVVAILDRNLSDDANASGRDQLTEALQALAEDPRFKQVVDAVQEKVDEAFTTTGRKRTGRGSPWANLREQRENAAIREREIGQQVDESEGVLSQVEALSAQSFDARSEAERLSTALTQRREREAAEQRLKAAEQELKVTETALLQLAENQQALAKAQERLGRLEADKETLAGGLATTAPKVQAARDQLRELESGAAEQGRRLREQEAENRRLTLTQDKATHTQRSVDAGRLAALEDQINEANEQLAALLTTLAEKRELVEAAREANGQDRDGLVRLELEHAVTGYLAAQEALDARKGERDAAREMAAKASELDTQAATLRHEAESQNAPDDAEYERLRAAETDWRLAEAKLSVGFVAELKSAAGADATVIVDGDAQPVRLAPGTPVELEANQELAVDIADLIAIHVRGGGRELVTAANQAKERWDAAARPVFGRTGCTTLDELTALRTRVASLTEEADGIDRQAQTARLQAERLDQLEQRVLTETANCKHLRGVVAEFVDVGQSVAELIAAIQDPRTDEAAIADEIKVLEEKVRDRERLCDRMDNEIEASARELAAGQRNLAADIARLREQAETLADWRGFLAHADAEAARLDQEVAAVETELDAIRTEATAEVDAARLALDGLAQQEARDRQALEDNAGALTQTRTDLARLEGETGPLQRNAEGKDLGAARASRDAARDALAALPPAEDVGEVDQLTQDLDRAKRLVRTLEDDLRKAEGALEQVGGQYLEEQRQQVVDARKALETRERELEMDYGAWRLLRETLADAEQSGAAHLGNALVEPISQRMGALTGGRYGDVVIGPQLDATGIELAGGKRPFQTLSVGTQEQLALLLRVAIAEALGTFLILDDQLTQSDAGRMRWIGELLADTARNIQVVVLTCHPADYRIDGTANTVDLTQCVTRTDAPTAASVPDRSDVQPRRRQRTLPANEQGGDDLAAALRESMARRES